MKIVSLFFLFFAPLITYSQNNLLPVWDYRSTETINAKVGIRYYFDKQNSGVSGFASVEYFWLRDVFSINKTNYSQFLFTFIIIVRS